MLDDGSVTSVGDAATDSQRRRYMQILNTALDVLKSSGYAHTSMEAIASQSGVGLGTIYRYFQSRDKLLFLATDAWLSNVARAARIERTDQKPKDRVLGAMRAGGERLYSEPVLLEAWVMSHLSSDPNVVELASQSTLFQDINAHSFRDDDDRETVEALGMVMENIWFAGLVRWALGHRKYERIVQEMEAAVIMVFDARKSATGHGG